MRQLMSDFEKVIEKYCYVWKYDATLDSVIMYEACITVIVRAGYAKLYEDRLHTVQRKPHHTSSQLSISVIDWSGQKILQQFCTKIYNKTSF